MRIQIKAVTEGGTKNDPTVIKKSVETVDGIKYSAFKTGKKGPLPGYDLIVTGAILDVEVYVSGKYKNIDAARAVTDATPVEKQQVAKAVAEHKADSLSDREKNSYIVRESCLSSAVALCTTSGMTPEIVLAVAQKFETWVLTGKTPTKTPETHQEAPGAAKATPVASPSQETAKSEWPHLEKLGDLWARCNEKNITIATAQGYLGIKRGLDWNGTPDEAWTKIEAAIANLKPG